MLKSAKTAATQRQPADLAARTQLAPDHQEQTTQAQCQAQPLPATDLLGRSALPCPLRHPDRREHRLQTHNQSGQAGTHAGFDRHPHAAQVACVHQGAGHSQVQPLAAAFRPDRAAKLYPDQKADDRKAVTQGQKGERRRIRQAELGNNEAGAPDQHKHHGHDSQPKAGSALPAGAGGSAHLVRARISGMAFCR